MIEPRDYFSAKEHNIKSILTYENKRFRVPDYQRNFAWTTDELQQLWNDFTITFNNSFNSDYTQKMNVKPHFFGTILLTESDHEYEITDGQQRLTVSTVFLKALLEISYKLNDPLEQSGVFSMITPLIQRNDYGEEYEQRVYLDSTINDLYKEYILLSTNQQDREDYLRLRPIRIQNPTSSQQRLKEAYEFFLTRLNKEFPDTLSQEELHAKLKAYIKTFTRLFTLLEIRVKDRETAYTIFGTINNRGKDLTDSDIIKNEIFKSVEENRRHEIKDKWDNIIDNIDTEDLTDYLRFQYASVFGPVKKMNLFKVITDLLGQRDPISYLEQLNNESEWYARVSLVGAPYWSEGITKKLEAFKTLDISHSLPLLLTGAVLYNDNETNFERIVNATLVFCFRYFTLAKNSVENLEKEIGKLSRALRNNEKTLDEVIEYLKELTTDQQFFNHFNSFVTKSNNIAFYILEQLEKNRMSGVVPLPHSPSQHVEHIMPKKPSIATRRINEWSHVRHNVEYKDFVYRLGNLIILESDLNQRVGNKDFTDKKVIYLTSGLSYPRDIAATYHNWDFGSITTRQERMAHEALNIWKYY
ncbi:DUF262 domain-containing protein [Priestia megaterium]|uniref:DUF262 domain-containing protein n=1 Tax=Priestia megaterium TaxID=1404 RepID=UPI000BFCF19F|nr:DUF262 domain-containing protein [Priestia megaterium]PGN04329.1 hypothetical protein CN955_21405 [Priestia megaterium]